MSKGTDLFDAMPKRQCPVCLRKTLGFSATAPKVTTECPLCGVEPDSEESRDRVTLYNKQLQRMLRLAGER